MKTLLHYGSYPYTLCLSQKDGSSISPACLNVINEFRAKDQRTVTFTRSHQAPDGGAQMRLYVNTSSPSSNQAVANKLTVPTVATHYVCMRMDYWNNF